MSNPSLNTPRNQAMALAGVFQACDLVNSIATKGLCDTEYMNASLQSVFSLESDSVDDIYSGPQSLKLGFKVLMEQLSNAPGKNLEIARYVATLLLLERKLSRRGDMLGQVAQGIKEAESLQVQHGASHDEVVSRLAETYRTTISHLTPRVMVQGQPIYLSHDVQAHRVRALLLAGLRSAVLWHQCGGRRWQLLLHRKKLLALSDQLRHA